MMIVQTKWMPIHILVIALSIALWFIVGFVITSVVVLDYEWHEIWWHLLAQGNFWLGMIIITYVIIGKDLYMNGLQRNFDPNSAQIVQEVFFLVFFFVFFFYSLFYYLFETTFVCY